MAPKKRKAEVEHGSRKKAAEELTTRRITRGMTTDAARRAVFETAELLENIFMQLPPRKIFVIQRVCKQFRDIVATSVKLQQRLFLRSDGTEAQEWRVAAKYNADAPNDDRLRTYRFVKSTYIPGADEKLGVAFTPVRLGLALEVEELEYGESASLSYPLAEQCVDFRQEMNCQGQSSLANTYLTHPPMQQGTLHVAFSFKSDSHTHYIGRIEVSKAEGLKIADVLRAIRYSRFPHISRYRSATQEGRYFKNVSLQDITGDEVAVEHASMELPGCIAPTEQEWAAMAS